MKTKTIIFLHTHGTCRHGNEHAKIIKMKSRYTLLFLIVIGVEVSAQPNGAIHAIVVTDTDRHLAQGSKIDKESITGLLEDVGRVNAQKLMLYCYPKSAFDHIDALGRINPEPNDMILFYYSGSSMNNGSGWPCLAKDEYATCVSSIDIMDELRKKHARLNIVLWDGCAIGETVRRVPRYPVATLSDRFDLVPDLFSKTALFSQLFADASGDVMMVASSPDHGSGFSYSSIHDGGFFTYSLVNALRKVQIQQSESIATSWQYVFDHTANSVAAMFQSLGMENCTQVPQAYISVQ